MNGIRNFNNFSYFVVIIQKYYYYYYYISFNLLFVTKLQISQNIKVYLAIYNINDKHIRAVCMIINL